MRQPVARRSAWLGGLVVGVGAGALSLVIPFVGWTIGLAFVVGAAMTRAIVPGLGGFLMGGGGTWLALLIRADVACRSFTGPGRECIPPDSAPWLAGGLAMLGAGLLLTLVAMRR